jgi:hypothetical protein
MTIEEQKAHFKALTAKMEEILFKKGNDYANQDRLSNFKLAGTIAGGSAETNCLNLIATKVARLGVLLNSGKAPNNESIQDSIIDLINYGVLLDMIVTENVPTGKALFCEGVNELKDKGRCDGLSHDMSTGLFGDSLAKYNDIIIKLKTQLIANGLTPIA